MDDGHASHLYDQFESNLKAAMVLFGALPDVYFWFCMNDFPILPRAPFPGPIPPRPPLGYCTRGDYHAISVPYKEQGVDGDKAVLGRLAELEAQHPWGAAFNQAVWRGSTTGERGCSAATWKELPRSKLVGLSLENPDILDARFAFNSQCPDDAAKLIEEEDYGYDRLMGLEDYFQHTMVGAPFLGWSPLDERFTWILCLHAARGC